MNFPHIVIEQRLAKLRRLALVGLAFLCLCALALMSAPRSAAAATSQELSLSGTTFELATNSPSIAEDGALDWTVIMKPSKNAQSASVRFQVEREGGSLIYRRTRYYNDIAASNAKKKESKTYSETFHRDLAGLSMREGSYTIRVEVTVSTKDNRESATLTSAQYVYDATQKPTPWVCAVHFTSQPLRDVQGNFVIDPSSGTPEAQRQALSSLARLANTQPNAHIMLYISPLLLEDFIDISQGYTLDLPNAVKTQTVNAEDAVPTRYAATLTELKEAIARGVITLGVVGYSDPNLTHLSQLQASDDITRQYARSLSTLTPFINNGARGIETTVTAPLGTRLTSQTLRALKTAKIDGVIVSDKAVKGATRVGTLPENLKGYVADSELSAALLSTTETSAVAQYFDAATQAKEDDEALITHSVVSTRSQAVALRENLETLLEQPWLSTTTLGSLNQSGQSRKLSLLTLSTRTASEDEKRVLKAREASESLVYALDEDVTSLKAREDSLIAEFGAPVASNSTEQAEDLRSAYAKRAQKTADDIYQSISIKMSPVTLSRREGQVPITINNGTKREVLLKLTITTSNGMTLDDESNQALILPPKETFLEPTVTMHNISAGKLSVTLTAAGYPVCEKTVKISASYIDTIVIVVIVVIIGITLLVFIYRRVATSDTSVNLFEGEHTEEEESTSL